MRDGEGQYGRRGFPGDKVGRWDIYLGIGQVQGSRNIGSKPIPRRFTILYWDSPNFAVKAIHQFGVNIIACELVTKEWCWYILGCYLAPGDGVTIWNMEAAMDERPGGEGQS